MTKKGLKLDERANPEGRGVIEHDCMDCGASWDTEGWEYSDECLNCGSDNFVTRKAINNPYTERGVDWDTCGFAQPAYPSDWVSREDARTAKDIDIDSLRKYTNDL